MVQTEVTWAWLARIQSQGYAAWWEGRECWGPQHTDLMATLSNHGPPVHALSGLWLTFLFA